MAKDDIIKCSKAYRDSAAFKRASFHTPDEIWSMFVDAEGFTDVVFTFKALVDGLCIDKDQHGQDLHGIKFYDALRSKLTSWKCQSLWDLLNVRLKCSEYRNGNDYVAKHMKCLIVGSGPIGLRTAVEMLMLGCQTVILEKRKDFTRNNVLHLWPFLMTDFRQLGAKKFCGKFGAGSIDHINIKCLQTILLKVALVLGVEIHAGVEFQGLVEPTQDHGWRVQVSPENYENISKQDFDVIVGADGKKNVLPGFTQIEMRGSLAIGITCNFINNNTPEEKCCKEISGISYQFKPAFFDELKEKHGVELENIVYYKDETHYFVMTARKSSLLDQKVLLKDFSDPSLLVQSSNINRVKLAEYTCNAVYYATTLPKVEFKKLSNGEPDIALFDFTSLKKSENASRIMERRKRKLLMALVGDSLIEPFWPTGSGCGRGVLSALDLAWMVRQFALNYPPLAILRERENVYKLLSASNHDNLQKNVNMYTIDPKTRYSSLDTKTIQNIDLLKALYDTDDVENADMTLSSPVADPRNGFKKPKMAGSAKKAKLSKGIVAYKTKGIVERQESKRNRNEDARSATMGIVERQESKRNRNEDAKQNLSLGDKKKFFEQHNQKMGGGGATKPKQGALHGDQIPGLQGIDEEIHESDDEVLEDEEPISKKKVGYRKSGSLKRQGSKENINMRRYGSKECLRRQSSRDGQKASKSTKRQSSTDDGESSSALNDDVFTTKKVYQAKGGGLKSKGKNEKSDAVKQKRRSTGDKKTGSSLRKRSKRSVSNQDELNPAAGSSSEFVDEQNTEGVPKIRENDESSKQVDAKTFFTKWMEKLLPKLFTESKGIPAETFAHPKDVCAQVSVVPVMALTLLYNCNKPVRSKTTELRLKELIANTNSRKNFQSQPSLEKRETAEELSAIKTGRVKGTMAKYQMMAEKEDTTHNFYEFIKKAKRSDLGGPGSDVSDGILLVKHEHSDFTPKDVIDVEEQLLADEEEERKRSPFAKMSKGGFPSGKGSELEVRLALEQLSDQQSPLSAILMLQVLYNVHKRILDEPKEDKHYRIYTKGETFQKHVWRWEGAKRYFHDTGWILCGDFLVLSKSRPLDPVVKVIEDVFRRNRKIQLSHSGSLNSQIEILVADGVALHPRIKDNEEHFADNEEEKEEASAITEDVDVPAGKDEDSAIEIGMGDDGDLDGKPAAQRNELQRLQSTEHNMGEEAYIVVDFVSEDSCDSDELPPMDTIDERSERSSVSDIVQITLDNEVEICEIQIENDSPFTTLTRSSKGELEDLTKDEGEFTLVAAHPGEEIEKDDVITITTWSVVANEESEDIVTLSEPIAQSDELPAEPIVQGDATQPEPIVQSFDTSANNVKSKGLKRQNIVVEPEPAATIEDIKTEKDPKESKAERKKAKKERKEKKKAFDAGHGLKKEKKGHEISPIVQDVTQTDVVTPVTPTIEVAESSTPIPTSPEQPVTSEIPVTSPSSIETLTQLFDKQIANSLKTRYTTPQDVLAPRLESVGKASVTAFDKSLFEGEVSKERRVSSPKDSGDLDLSGKVSGARSLFEGGSPRLTPRDSEGDSPRLAPSDRESTCSKDEPIQTNNVEEVTETTVAEVEVPIIVTNPEVNKTKKKKNPFKKKKHKEKKDEIAETDNVAPPLVVDAITKTDNVALVVDTDIKTDNITLGVDTNTKTDNVALVTDTNQSYEERAIDVPEQASDSIPHEDTNLLNTSTDVTPTSTDVHHEKRKNPFKKKKHKEKTSKTVDVAPVVDTNINTDNVAPVLDANINTDNVAPVVDTNISNVAPVVGTNIKPDIVAPVVDSSEKNDNVAPVIDPNITATEQSLEQAEVDVATVEPECIPLENTNLMNSSSDISHADVDDYCEISVVDTNIVVETDPTPTPVDIKTEKDPKESKADRKKAKKERKEKKKALAAAQGMKKGEMGSEISLVTNDVADTNSINMTQPVTTDEKESKADRKKAKKERKEKKKALAAAQGVKKEEKSPEISPVTDDKADTNTTDITQPDNTDDSRIPVTDTNLPNPPNTDITITNDHNDVGTRVSESAVDNSSLTEEDSVSRTSSSSFVTKNRNSKKRPRLSKKRGADTLTLEDEEVVTETLVVDIAASDFSFDKLADLENSTEIVSEQPNNDIMEVHVDKSVFNADNQPKDVMEVHVDTSIFTQNITPIEVDVNSLTNGTNEGELTAPIICVTETLDNAELDNDEAVQPMDEMNVPTSETTASFYDSSMDLSGEVEHSADTLENEPKKKKKKFPFRIPLGKKDKHKKSKATSSEDLSLSSSSSLSPPTSHHLDIDSSINQGHEKEKVKSKKLHFFKKKKSGSSTPVPKVTRSHSSSQANENELRVRDDVDGRSASTPSSPVLSTSHLHTNGHTNHDDNSADRLV